MERASGEAAGSGAVRVLDLFAGIGGFSLAAHWMGWETVAFVEKEPFCQKVLRKNFGQDIEIHDDVTTFSGKPFRGRVDIVTGGFPCQPFSNAGQKRGKDDERHIFPEMLRVVEEVAPRWVVAENVRGLLGSDNGNVFEEVCSSMERVGYTVQTFCIPASAINAPHRRDRLWIIALSDSYGESVLSYDARAKSAGIWPPTHPEGDRTRRGSEPVCGTQWRPNERLFSELGNTDLFTTNGNEREPERNGGADGKAESDLRRHEAGDVPTRLAERNVSDASSKRLEGATGSGVQRRSGRLAEHDRYATDPGLVGQSRQGELAGRCDSETSREREVNRTLNGYEPETGWGEDWPQVAARLCRMDDVIPQRVDRLRALGNAVVPALVYEIFKAIEQADRSKTQQG